MRAHGDTIARWIDNSENKTVRANFGEFRMASIIDRIIYHLLSIKSIMSGSQWSRNSSKDRLIKYLIDKRELEGENVISGKFYTNFTKFYDLL